MPPRILGALVSLLISGAATVVAADTKPVNLLRVPAVVLEQAGTAAADRKELAALTDDDPATVSAAAAPSEDDPLTIVYGFGGATVALEKLVITLPSPSEDAAPPERVDLLVSTLSPHASFQSVRADPLKSGPKPQEFSFAAIGAKWIMLRFTPGKKGGRVPIAEIAILGNEGPPITRYKFKESPARALDVLKRLQDNSSLDVSISSDEAALFADAKDGKLDEWSFGEAALLASGVLDSRQRKEYAARLDKIEADARKVVATGKTPFDKGQALLKFLHTGPMAKGYVAQQTDLAAVLDTGTFNCVSSATLYNVIGRRLGLDCRGIEVPHHAFAILYDGAKHADIETTTDGGFNPARDRAAQEQFTKLTGFAYIPDSNRHERREVSEAGLVAITYYNHAVKLTEDQQHHAALLAYFRAMSLDPEFDSAVKNALAVLANWSLALAKDKKYKLALEVLATGLELAPKDATLVNNHKAVWGEWADTLIKDGQADEALAVLRRADKAVPDGDFLKMQAWVFIRPGEEFAKAREWEKAMALVGPGRGKLDPRPREELEEWGANLVHRWAQDEQKNGRYDQATAVVERALTLTPADKKLINHLAYVVQEWCGDTYARQGAEKAEALVGELLNRFGDFKDVRQIAIGHAHRVVKDLIDKGQYEDALASAARSGGLLSDEQAGVELAWEVYDLWAAKLTRNKEWQQAVDLYVSSLHKFPKDKHLENNLQATWDQWAQSHITGKDWDGALKVYEQALKQHPDPRHVEMNIKFAVQEWAKQSYQQDGGEAAETLLVKQLQRFVDVKDLRGVAKGHLQRVVQELAGKKRYDDALATIARGKDLLMDDKEVSNLAGIVFDSWANDFAKKKDWQSAVDVYANGLKKFPKDRHLEQNAIATWFQWAKTFMDEKDWAGAVQVYEKALLQFPDNGTLKNNLKFCLQKKK